MLLTAGLLLEARLGNSSANVDVERMLMKIAKRKTVPILIVLFIVVMGSVEFAYLQSGPTDQYFHDEATNLSFTYNTEFTQQLLSELDRSQNYITRITNSGEIEDQFLITARKEPDFSTVSNATGKSPLDIALSSLERSFPDVYPNFSQLRQLKFDTAGVNASEVVFTYDSPAGEKAKQHLLMLQRNQDEIVFVSFQALEKDFAFIDEKYFQLLRDSISFE